jgi:hypothetical protein
MPFITYSSEEQVLTFESKNGSVQIPTDMMIDDDAQALKTTCLSIRKYILDGQDGSVDLYLGANAGVSIRYIAVTRTLTVSMYIEGATATLNLPDSNTTPVFAQELTDIIEAL